MITDEQIAAWKKQHGEVIEITINAEPEDNAVCYIKPADGDRVVMARTLTMSAKGQLLEAGEFVLQNCWLGGDERCKNFENHGKIAIAAAMQATKSLNLLEATIGKI